MRDRLANICMLLAVFLLPWQTRWIYGQLQINGSAWEYGALSVYVVELVLAAALLLRGWPQALPGSFRPMRSGMMLLAACFFSVALAQSLPLSMAMMVHVLGAFCLFMLVIDVRTRTRDVALAFVAGLLLPSALGWWQVVVGASPAMSWFGLASHEAMQSGASVVETASERILRAYGSLPHPNIFGGYLAVGLVLLAWLTYRQPFARAKVLIAVLSAGAIVFASTLVVTFSRGAWLSLGGGLLVLIALMLWFRKMPPREAFPIATIGLLAVMATLVVFHSAIFTRFEPGARLEAKSIAERAGEWQYVDDVVRYNPVTGVGVGGYTATLAKAVPDQEVWAYQPVHNALMLALAEIGLIGFAALVWFVGSIDKVSYRVARSGNGIFAMALGTVLLIVALFDHYVWSLWAGLALAAVCLALMLRWSLEAESRGAAAIVKTKMPAGRPARQ